MKISILPLIGALSIIAFFASFVIPPNPKIYAVEDSNGQFSIQLKCPPGWQGFAAWHTTKSDDSLHRLAGYINDARDGVCEKAGTKHPEAPVVVEDAPNEGRKI